MYDVLEIDFLTAYDAHRFNHDGVKTHWIAICNAAKVDPKTVKIGELDKISEIGWFNINNLPKPQHSQLHKAIKAAKENKIIE